RRLGGGGGDASAGGAADLRGPILAAVPLVHGNPGRRRAGRQNASGRGAGRDSGGSGGTGLDGGEPGDAGGPGTGGSLELAGRRDRRVGRRHPSGRLSPGKPPWSIRAGLSARTRVGPG